MQQPRLVSGGGQRHGLGNVAFGNTIQSGLLFIHQQPVFRLVVFHVPIDVHNAIRAFPQIADAPRDGGALGQFRPVDFGHQGFEHRRSGRHLRHLDAGSILLGHR